MRSSIIFIILFSLIFCSEALAGTIGRLADSHALTFVSGCADAAKGKDHAASEAAQSAAISAGAVAYGVGTAAAAGAGNLAGYAGIASAVSTLGLSSVTAAATAVVTSAVGGPVVMGCIIVGGVSAASYGAYKGGQALWEWFSD